MEASARAVQREDSTEADRLRAWAADLVADCAEEEGLHAVAPWTATSAKSLLRVPYIKSMVSERTHDLFGCAAVLPSADLAELLTDTVCIMLLAGPSPHQHVYGCVWGASRAAAGPSVWRYAFDGTRNGVSMLVSIVQRVRGAPAGSVYARRDVQGFFSGVTADTVAAALRKHRKMRIGPLLLGLYDACAQRVVAHLREWGIGLPAGVFASHLLAELVLREGDDVLARLCRRRSVSLLRMGDDYHFVGARADVGAAVAAADRFVRSRGWRWNAAKTEDLVIGNEDKVLDALRIPVFLRQQLFGLGTEKITGTSFAEQRMRIEAAAANSLNPYFGQDGHTAPDVTVGGIVMAVCGFVRVMVDDTPGTAADMLREFARDDNPDAEMIVPCAAQCLLLLRDNERAAEARGLRGLADEIAWRNDTPRSLLRALRHVLWVLPVDDLLAFADGAGPRAAARRDCSASRIDFARATLYNELQRRAQCATNLSDDARDRVRKTIKRVWSTQPFFHGDPCGNI